MAKFKGFYVITDRPMVTGTIPFFFTDTKFKLNIGVYTKLMRKLTMVFDIRHDCEFKRS